MGDGAGYSLPQGFFTKATVAFVLDLEDAVLGKKEVLESKDSTQKVE